MIRAYRPRRTKVGALLACLGACAPSAARRDARSVIDALALQPVLGTMADTTVTAPAPATESIGAYLRNVADALAAPDATAEAVLAAARAREVQRGRDDATFLPPIPRLGKARVDLTSVGGVGTAPGTVVFRIAEGGVPVRVSEIADVFGAWSPGTAGPGPANLWPLVFTDKYRSTPWRTSGGAPIFVSVSLSGDPTDAATRVERILLRRDRY